MRARLFAIFEVVVVFLAGMFAARWLGLEAPLTRVGMAVAAAAAIDLLLRRQRIARWGLIPSMPLMSVLRLLALGGLPALVITALAPPQPAMAWSVAGLAVPLLAQELFVMGYAHARLRDAFSPRIVAIVVAVIFVAAHARHASNGVWGIAFLAAMAWQGVWWSVARTARQTILPLAAAHALLLVLYTWPAAAAAGLFVVGIVVFGAIPLAASKGPFAARLLDF